MGETDDPRVALQDKDVTTRAAAARDLAKVGSFDDLLTLIAIARDDKSPSVRLYAAAAAADIAMRLRGTSPRSGLSKAKRQQLLEAVTAGDPGHNPSLLVALAAMPEKKVIDRLGRMMRDPRNGVRAGAATAVRRMALSSASASSDVLPERVGHLLEAGRLPPDAVLELVKLVGEAGWKQLAPQVRNAATAGRPHGAAVQQTLQRLGERETPEAWSGLWAGTGSDVFEPDGTTLTWIVVCDGTAWGPDGPEPAVTDGEAGLQIGGRPYRRIWAPRLAEPGQFEALQGGGQTYWRRADKDLAVAAEALVDDLAAHPEASRTLVDMLRPVEGATAPRVSALLLWRSGALAEAEAVIDELCAVKKPRADLHWIQANVKLGLGDLDTARSAVGLYLDRAAKNAPHRADAEALKASLGG